MATYSMIIILHLASLLWFANKHKKW